MTILRESMIYQLWLALLAVYDESRSHAPAGAPGSLVQPAD